jgi:hypothetical protein
MMDCAIARITKFKQKKFIKTGWQKNWCAAFGAIYILFHFRAIQHRPAFYHLAQPTPHLRRRLKQTTFSEI